MEEVSSLRFKTGDIVTFAPHFTNTGTYRITSARIERREPRMTTPWIDVEYVTVEPLTEDSYEFIGGEVRADTFIRVEG